MVRQCYLKNGLITGRSLLVAVGLLAAQWATASEVTKEIETFEPDWYIGAKAGWGLFGQGCEDWASDCDDNSPAGGVFFGYNFNHWLGLEAGYTYLGEAVATYTSGEVTGTMQSLDLFLRARMPLTERLGLYGKAGGIYWDAENEHAYGKTESDGGDVALGAGLTYRFSQNWAGQLEYQLTPGLGDSKVGGTNHNMLTLGILYVFGSGSETIHYTTESETNEKVAVFQSRISDSLFDFDSAEIKDASVLSPYVSRLKENPESEIVVVGHTDDVGSEEYNQTLSEQRAQAVRNYFISEGIGENRVHAYGLGEAAPIASNDTEEGRAMNRRVELSSPGFETNLIHTQSQEQ